MWPDRYTVYYSREKHYAVRWLTHGRPESEAEYRTFDDKAEAERLYNSLVDGKSDESRVELFFSETKWVAYQSNGAEHGTTVAAIAGQSHLCQDGEHHACADDDDTALCTCWCHAPVAL